MVTRIREEIRLDDWGSLIPRLLCGGRREAWEWGYDWGNQEVWTVISPAWLVIFIESCTSTLYRGWMDYTWLQRVGGWSACSIYWTTAALEWMIRLPVLGVQLSITALLQAMEPTSHSSVCSFCWSGEQTKTGRLMRQLLIQRLVIFIRVCINDDWKYQTCMGPNQGVFFFCIVTLGGSYLMVYNMFQYLVVLDSRLSHVCKGLVPRLSIALFCRQNMSGQTALHLAARIGHVKCLRALLEHGANIGIMVSINYMPVPQFQATHLHA